jgi:hypothetical protein
MCTASPLSGLIHLPTERLLHPATGEGWDGGDARVIDVASNADNPPSQPSTNGSPAEPPFPWGKETQQATTALLAEKAPSRMKLATGIGEHFDA